MIEVISRWVERATRRFPRFGAKVLAPAAVVYPRFHDDQLGVQAGSLTYGAFLALPPILILALSAVSLIAANDATAQQRMIDSITGFIPGFSNVLADQFSLGTAQQLGLGLTGVVALLYAASSFATRTRTALGVVFRTGLPYLLAGRISGTLIGIPCFAGFVGMAVLAQWTLSRHLPWWAAILASIGLLILAWLLFLMIYWALTPGKVRPALRDHIPGAIVCAVGGALLERVGGAYIARVIGKTTALYGTIGTIFGLLAFIYMMMWMFLLGAEISQALRQPPSTS